MEGVRFPFSNMGASLPPMKVVRAARPGIAGTVVVDIVISREESVDAKEDLDRELKDNKEEKEEREKREGEPV